MNRSRRSFPLIAAGLLVGSLIGCTARGGCSGDYCGTLVIAAAGEPDILLPPIIQLAVARDVSDQLFLKLADVGMSANTSATPTSFRSSRRDGTGPTASR